MNAEMTPAQLRLELAHFTGDLDRFRHWLRKLLYTPGVKYLADTAGAYWLIDLVASYQADKKITSNEELKFMQFWKLEVDLQKKTAVATCTDGNSDKPVIKQEIEYTDFPLDEISLYVCDNGDGTRTLMLTGEY